MMMVKNPVILLACVLLFSSLTVLAYQGSFSPDECCFKFIPTRLRKDRVVSYRHTDNRCTMEGVLFTMTNGNEICADASLQWVKRLMKIKERVQINGTNVYVNTTMTVNAH